MSTKEQKSFFETYAHEYDYLTDATKRKVSHKKEVDALIEKYNPQSVLDAGCATGLTAMLFAESDIPTKGIDNSRPMIKLAKQNYGDKSNLTFQTASFEKLPKSLHNKFDLIVCLANAISGVGSLHNLSRSLKGFYQSLKPGGILVLQALNYISIVDGELLPIRATQHKNLYYQRFSERKGKSLYVYVNRLDVSTDPLKSEMFRHEFENFTPPELVASLKKTNFKKINKHSDLFLKKKFVKSSRDLVLTAVKS